MVIPEFKHGVHEVSDGLVVKLGFPANVGRHVAEHGLHFPPGYCSPDLPPGVGHGEVTARQSYRPLDRLHVQKVTRDHKTLRANNLGGDLAGMR